MITMDTYCLWEFMREEGGLLGGTGGAVSVMNVSYN